MEARTVSIELPGKNILASKTVWWNVLTTAAQCLDVIAGAGIIPQPAGMIVSGVVNVILRACTTQPLMPTVVKARQDPGEPRRLLVVP